MRYKNREIRSIIGCEKIPQKYFDELYPKVKEEVNTRAVNFKASIRNAINEWWEDMKAEYLLERQMKWAN